MTSTLAPTQSTFQTIETTATVDEHGVLKVAPLVGVAAGEVRLIVFVTPQKESEAPDLSRKQWHAGLSRLMAPHFADDPEEDIYSKEDGKPYDAKQD